MKTNLLRIITILFLTTTALLGVGTTVLAVGPSMRVNPGTMILGSGQTQTYSISLDTAGLTVFGADARLTYNPAAVEISSITKGAFFTDFNFSHDPAAGTIELHGYFGTLYDYKSGTGNLATMTVKSKQSSGSTTIDLVCNTTNNTSRIVDNNGQNILPCAETSDSVITFSSSTIIPSPTGSTGPTPSLTPTPKPNPICHGLSVSPSSGTKPLQATLVCSGSSSHTDVNAAEFTLGNGEVKLVEKNAGQFGSISLAYAYPNAGSYGVTCRMRDNNGHFSDTPDTCKSNIVVSEPQTQGGGNVGTTYRPTPTPKKDNDGSYVVELTPAPTETIAPTPSPTTAPEQKSLKDTLLRIGLPAVLLVISVLLYGQF